MLISRLLQITSRLDIHLNGMFFYKLDFNFSNDLNTNDKLNIRKGFMNSIICRAFKVQLI